MINLTPRKVSFLQIALIITLGFSIYANSLSGDFLWDDEFLVKDNIYIKNWTKIPYIFTESIGMGAGREGPCYRPIQMITYAVDFSLWGLNLVGYHLTNTLLHISVALAIYWLVNTLYNRRFLSLLTSILFVVHPIHTEAVAYISGRADSLAAVFILLCLTCYIKQSSLNNTTTYALMLLSYILALLSKEHSLILPMLLILYSYVFKRKILVKEFSSIISITFIYIILRLTILRFASSNVNSATTLFQRMPGFFVAITEYIRLLLLPFNLNMEYGDKLFSFSNFRAILGVVVLFMLLIYAFKKRESDKLISFSIYWFFIILLPVSNLYPINAYMAEHWLYLPSIGFFLILAHGLILLYTTKKIKFLAIFLMITILTFYSYLAIRQNNYWKEPIAFYKKTLHYAPNSSRLYQNLGKAYSQTGNYEEAIKALQKAIEITPKNADIYNLLGTVYSAKGNTEKTISLYQKAIAINPNCADAYYNLGNAYIAISDTEKAIASYRKAIEVAPRHVHVVSYYNNLASIYVLNGKIEEAIALYEKALEIEPNNVIVNSNIRKLHDAIVNNKEKLF